MVNIAKTNFERNKAGSGGALFLENSELFLDDTSTIKYNSADIGGGIRYKKLIPFYIV